MSDVALDEHSHAGRGAGDLVQEALPEQLEEEEDSDLLPLGSSPAPCSLVRPPCHPLC